MFSCHDWWTEEGPGVKKSFSIVSYKSRSTRWEKSFSQKGSVNIHIKAVHLKEKDQKCTLCLRAFSAASFLRLHMKTQHFGVKEDKNDAKAGPEQSENVFLHENEDNEAKKVEILVF